MAEQLIFRLVNIDLLVAAQHVIIPANANGLFFVPSRYGIELVEKSGVIGVDPVVRLGNSVNNDNLSELTTLTGLTDVLDIQHPTLIVNKSINVTTNPIIFEVETPGDTAEVYKANIYLVGYLR